MATPKPITPIVQLLRELEDDLPFALDYIFSHRHPDKTPEFHTQIVQAWASDAPRVLVEVFRGGAKSTIAEEFIALAALFGYADYILIVGNTYSAAVDRLSSIKYELENNERLATVFGNVRGSTWSENDIVLANRVRIQAFGAGQSVRGAKSAETNKRPDLVLIDDLEDREAVATPEARQKMWKWLTRELIPACDPKARIRVNGTPLHTESLIERLKVNENWNCLSFPLYTMDGDGRKPMWPQRFPVEKIAEMQAQFEADGDMMGFSQEYLLKPMDNLAAAFDKSDLRLVDRQQDYAPRILIVDPARTVKASSARTGYAVVSWVGNELHIHEAHGRHDTPAEIINHIFELAGVHQPMTVAFEQDGLMEWAMQPLRAEMARRGDILPLQAVKAPKDKLGFIKGLQPFLRAREVFVDKAFPDLEQEMASFPVGKMDVLNALAYALRLRPGMPVYQSFTSDHVSHRNPHPRAEWFLFVNATAGMLYAVLAFVQDGVLCVTKDWVQEGSLDDALRAVFISASGIVPANRKPTIIVPYDRTLANDHSGLPSTLRRLHVEFRAGKRISEAQESLDQPLRTRRSGTPLFLVSPDATWTLNAMAGGYCREAGATAFAIRENPHKYVAQALECGYAAISGYALEDDGRADVVYARSSSGRQFISMRR